MGWRWWGWVWGISVAQPVWTLSGYVRDKANREPLPGASVVVKERGTGTYTNAYGYYALRLPAGRYTVVAQFLGYRSETLQVVLQRDLKQDFSLEEEGVQVTAVEIVETYEQRRFSSAATSQNRLEVQRLKKLPALLGEVDVLRSLSLLPGVATAGDGSASFFVRGGSFDQNLVLLDEAVVYNPGHIGGIFSAFNADAVQEVQLYKGYMPPEYGGRLASALDVRLREGNSPRWQAAGGIGLISSRLNVEGPLWKDRAGLLLTGRRSYADLFLLLARDPELRQAALYFYDLTAKLNYRAGEKHRFYLSGYFGRDVFRTSFLDFNWGNATTTLRWNFIPSPRLFLNTIAYYSKYDYVFLVEQGNNRARFSSGIEDWAWRSDGEYFLSERLKLRFGAGVCRHTFLPGILEPTSDSSNVRPYRVPSLRGVEAAAYVQTGYKWGARWLVEGGAATARIWVLGAPYPVYLYVGRAAARHVSLWARAFYSGMGGAGAAPELALCPLRPLGAQGFFWACAAVLACGDPLACRTAYRHLVAYNPQCTPARWLPSGPGSPGHASLERDRVGCVLGTLLPVDVERAGFSFRGRYFP